MYVINYPDALYLQQDRPGQEFGVVEMRDAGAGAADGAIHAERAPRHAPQPPALGRAGVVDEDTVGGGGIVVLAVLHIERHLARPDPRQRRRLLDPDTGVGSGVDGGEVNDHWKPHQSTAFRDRSLVGKKRSKMIKSIRP